MGDLLHNLILGFSVALTLQKSWGFLILI